MKFTKTISNDLLITMMIVFGKDRFNKRRIYDYKSTWLKKGWAKKWTELRVVGGGLGIVSWKLNETETELGVCAINFVGIDYPFLLKVFTHS